MRRRYVAGVSAIAVAAATYILFARPWHLHWGASAHECGMSLPGGDFIVSPDLTATRAITVRASAGQFSGRQNARGGVSGRAPEEAPWKDGDRDGRRPL